MTTPLFAPAASIAWPVPQAGQLQPIHPSRVSLLPIGVRPAPAGPLAQCMGGWCPASCRNSCAHHHAEAIPGQAPHDRLCPPWAVSAWRPMADASALAGQGVR